MYTMSETLREVVIADAGRTAIGRLNGTLATVPASRLGADLIRAMLARSKLSPDKIDAVLLGQTLTAGVGRNPARQAAIHAGLTGNALATTLDQGHGSGLAAIIHAVQQVAVGDAQWIIAGGQESASQAPHLLPGSRKGRREGAWTLADSLDCDGTSGPLNHLFDYEFAEKLAQKHEITRELQDQWAVRSHQRAEQAGKTGRFEAEILSVDVPQRAGEPIGFARDEYPLPGASEDRLAGYKPLDGRQGTVTKGNCSSAGDGAAAVVMTTMANCRALGLVPMARIAACAGVGIKPSRMDTILAPAIQACLSRAKWQMNDLDLIEVGESSASEMIVASRVLQWSNERINVSGGAIALGRPIGAAGARMLVTLLHEMLRQDSHRGLVAVDAGDGQGIALAVER